MKACWSTKPSLESCLLKLVLGGLDGRVWGKAAGPSRQWKQVGQSPNPKIEGCQDRSTDKAELFKSPAADKTKKLSLAK